MANRKLSLTAGNIKYLLAVYKLNKDNKGTKCVRIAELLKVTKPSVHTMINTLTDMGLVEKNHYGDVFFTENGLRIAAKYNEYYFFVSNLFSNYLFYENDVRCAACAVLAEISDEGLEQFLTAKNAEKENNNVCDGIEN